MRNILFRGKRVDNGEWVAGLLARYNQNFDVANMVNDFDLLVPVDTKTVEQFTGLTDKNGTKIFEGDIVKVRQERKDGFCTIGYENSSFMVHPLSGDIYERTLFEYWYNDWDLECIGNIHDNPELLTEAKK